MNPTEAVLLVEYVLALCPHQKTEEYTPDAWYDVLAPFSLDDCRQAVQIRVTAGHAFVAVGEIITEVKRIRAARLKDSVRATQPPPGEIDERTYRHGLRQITGRLADGQPPPFRGIEDGRAKATEAANARDYQALRQAWEDEQRAKKAAEKASREARYAEEEAHSAAVRRFTEAYALLLVLEPEAQLDARNRAIEELGPEASAEDIAIRAAELADYTRVAAVPIDDATRQSLARRGCPTGCPIGTHDPACRFATDAEGRTA